MTNDLDTQPADIAFLRSLAEEGAKAPLGGGLTLMMAGLIYGGASLFQWAAVKGYTPFSPRESNWIWIIATVVFLALCVVDGFRCQKSGVRTAANRAARAAWSCVGAGIFACIASMAAVSWRLNEAGAPSTVIWLLPSMVMVFYGLGWGVTAAMFRSGRLAWLTIGSFIAAPLLALMTGSASQFLGYAASLFILMALPGFLLMRAASKVRAAKA